MKKIFFLILAVILLGGCSFTSDDLDGAKIYVTNYPIKYLVETIYKDHATVESVYPKDVDTTTYELTDKQVKEYSKAKMFVYNGLSNEKNIAKKFINKNRNILIMDVSLGLSINSSIEELWLSPNNYLMLAKNVKNSFDEYLSSKYLKEEIQQNYDIFAEKISIMDADLRRIASEANKNGKTTVVVTKTAYKFLENYGFIVVDLSDESYQTDTAKKVIETNFDSSKYICLIADANEESEIVTNLVDKHKAKKIVLNTMTVGITNDDYLDNLQEFIDALQNVVE